MLVAPWAVDGAKVSAVVLRLMAWAATNGSNGIVRPGDLRVSALATPGGAVNVAPGGALAVMAYPGNMAAQTYVAYNDASTQVAIPATGSAGGRTDYIIVRIDDWNINGDTAPADPLNYVACSFQRVSSITALPYPAVVLAKVTIPASTGTITQAMITDLRTMAQVQEKTVRRPVSATATETLSNSTTGEYFPNAGGRQLIDIPSWATRVQIRAEWNSMYWPGGNCQGQGWVGFGDWTGTQFEVVTQLSAFDNVQSTNPSRGSLIVNDEVAIPAKYRGRSNVTFQMWAKKYNSANVGAKIDTWSNTLLEVRFMAVPDNSATS